MLPTFVIGLREGLEAALIVGIIAAFLGQQGRRDALRQVWVGTAAAVLICIGIGVALQVISSELPQRQQEQTSLMNDYVWAGTETDQPWMRGGSYLVARKIRIFVENRDRDYLQDQENVIGRSKVDGAPLTGGPEFSTPDFGATIASATGSEPVIPAHAHIRLASFEHNSGTRILRRGYSFTDEIDPQAGTLLGGLFLIAFMKNPSQFIQLQRSLAADALNEYTQHTGSAVFACPPGLRSGQYWGDSIFA